MSIDPADMYPDSNSFEDFWNEVKEYAKEVGVTPQYIEEEFIIDGELLRVDPVYLTPIGRDS